MSSNEDLLYINGFAFSISEHIAVEKTAKRPGGVEVSQKTEEIMSNNTDEFFSLWNLLVSSGLNPTTPLIYLEGLAKEANPDNEAIALLPYIAGYAIGAACAGYTPIALCDENAAIHMLTGELWYAKRYVEEDHCTGACRLGTNERLLLDYDDGEFVKVRWAGSDVYDPSDKMIHGAGLPDGTPILITSTVEEIRKCS